MIVPYGIEPLGCEGFDDAVVELFENGNVAVGSGFCWLLGEGEDARFVGGCESPPDQYHYKGNLMRPAADSDWIVPHSIADSMAPIRNEHGEFSANVFVVEKNEFLQILLIQAGIVRVSCVPELPGDACHRLRHAESIQQR
ncbi:hypothetical protein ACNOYE_26825 [Nannocystaceae bacterium ST9]